jgi:GT2 family glycosyltransferase
MQAREYRPDVGRFLSADRFEVVVFDDASADDTAEVLRRASGAGGLALRSLTATANVRQGAGRNRGWRAVGAPLIAFTDDDCEATSDWLEEGLRAAREHPGSIVQGRTVPHPGELHRYGPFARTMSIDRLGPFYQTCNIFYPRAVLERFGGFDERLAEGEDADLAWRCLQGGERAVFAPHAVVFHAIENLGVRGHLRVARRWSDAMRMFRYRGLRDEVLTYGVFWKRSHELLVPALIGLALGRRSRAALLLALPYLRYLRHRCRQSDAPLALAPYFVLFDIVETYTAARGAIRHRVLVI